MPQRPIRIRTKPVDQHDGRDRQVDHRSSAAIRSAEAVDDDAELAADLDAEQHRNDGNGARAEERTELAERQDAVVEKPASEDQSRRSPTKTNSTPASDSAMLRTVMFERVVGPRRAAAA